MNNDEINQLELFVFLPVETGKKLSKQQRQIATKFVLAI